MQLTVEGKRIQIGEALKTHVEEKLTEIRGKYFNRVIIANVLFSREGHGHGLFVCNISIKVGKSINVVSESKDSDPYAAFDSAAVRISKQLRRYKRRLRDDHDRIFREIKEDPMRVLDYTIASAPHSFDDDEADDFSHGEDPAIIAETKTEISTMAVSDAVMRMDLEGQNVFVFRNPKNKELNIVYRRPDGNIGWLDLSKISE